MGIEPTTSSMPSRRAPNCATAPRGEIIQFITACDTSLASSIQAFPDFIFLIQGFDGYAAIRLRK